MVDIPMRKRLAAAEQGLLPLTLNVAFHSFQPKCYFCLICLASGGGGGALFGIPKLKAQE